MFFQINASVSFERNFFCQQELFLFHPTGHPLSWINENHTQMTEEFLEYARPLIQAELTPLYIAGLPHHIYMKNQK